MKVNRRRIKPGANLAGLDLFAAHLIRTNLSGADLTEANLNAAKLSGATMPDGTIHP